MSLTKIRTPFNLTTIVTCYAFEHTRFIRITFALLQILWRYRIHASSAAMLVLESNLEICVPSDRFGDFRLQSAQHGNETSYIFSMERKQGMYELYNLSRTRVITKKLPHGLFAFGWTGTSMQWRVTTWYKWRCCSLYSVLVPVEPREYEQGML